MIGAKPSETPAIEQQAVVNAVLNGGFCDPAHDDRMIARRMDGESIAMERRQAAAQGWRAIRPFGPVKRIEIVATPCEVIGQSNLIRRQNMNAKGCSFCEGVVSL